MPKKTNKTSHVLNLITSGGTSEAEEKTPESDPEEREDTKTPRLRRYRRRNRQSKSRYRGWLRLIRVCLS